MRSKISKMRRTAMRLQEELGREPTDEEIAGKLDVEGQRPASFLGGGPLTNSVEVKSQHDTLQLSYKLLGADVESRGGHGHHFNRAAGNSHTQPSGCASSRCGSGGGSS